MQNADSPAESSDRPTRGIPRRRRARGSWAWTRSSPGTATFRKKVWSRRISDADVFVLLSLYEGFGLTVLEAMACGTPVVCSARGSLPEVAGSAALLVDPDDSAQAADAIVRVLEDVKLAAELREKGVRQAAKFTWTRTAAMTLKAYEHAMSLK